MRFETIIASQYFVGRLQFASVVTHIRDEGDILLLDLRSGERVSVHIVERELALHDIRYYFETNQAAGMHTLMILWADMLLPPDGAWIDMPEWLEVLAALYADRVYAFEVAGHHSYFFPIHLRGEGRRRQAAFGDVIDYAALGCSTVSSQTAAFVGSWRVADFTHHGQTFRSYTTQQFPERMRALLPHFSALGLEPDANPEQIKQAYRALARLYHPDVNADPSADERMKQLNHAYQQLMDFLGGN
jgi:hypothetical protein